MRTTIKCVQHPTDTLTVRPSNLYADKTCVVLSEGGDDHKVLLDLPGLHDLGLAVAAEIRRLAPVPVLSEEPKTVPEFKVGDRVRVVQGGWDLPVGSVFVLKKVTDEYLYVGTKSDGWDRSRFVPARVSP